MVTAAISQLTAQSISKLHETQTCTQTPLYFYEKLIGTHYVLQKLKTMGAICSRSNGTEYISYFQCHCRSKSPSRVSYDHNCTKYANNFYFQYV